VEKINHLFKTTILFLSLIFNIIFIFTTTFCVEYPASAAAGYWTQGGGGIYDNTPRNDSLPKENQGVLIEEHLGQKLDLSLSFLNQDGHTITLGELTKEKKPLLLSLNYYRCKTLCGLQLINLARTIKDLGWPIGEDFSMVTVSFDPTDTPALAKEKQQEYLKLTDQPHGDWSFLTGSQKAIDTLTQKIGFFYNYIPQTQDYSHTAAIFFISPDGTITRYLYGITYNKNDIKFSIMDAASHKVGNTVDQVLLFCHTYDPNAGAYTGFALGLMRVVGIITLVCILGTIVFLGWKKHKKTE
jgi:protein SCO1/2